MLIQVQFQLIFNCFIENLPHATNVYQFTERFYITFTIKHFQLSQKKKKNDFVHNFLFPFSQECITYMKIRGDLSSLVFYNNG